MKKLFLLSIVALMTCSLAAQDLVPKHNDKGVFGYGWKDSDEFVIKPQWDEARPFNEYGIAIVRKGSMFGLINKTGKPVGKSMGYSMIAPYEGTDYLLVAEGGAPVTNASALKGRTSLNVFGFRGSMSYLIKGAKWGLMRQDGQFQITPAYQEISSVMENDLIVIQQKNYLGVIDINGKEIFPANYMAMTPFNNQGVAAFRNRKTFKWSIVDKSGRTIIGEDQNLNLIYQYTMDELGLINMVSIDSLMKNKALRRSPERLMPIMNSGFTWINTDQPYLLTSEPVKKKESPKWNLFDLNGNKLINSEIVFVCAPSEGITIGYKGDRAYLHNIETKTTAQIETRDYLPFHNGHSMSVSKDRTDYYLIDKTGKRASDHFDAVERVDECFIVKSGDKYGLISTAGKEIIPMECKSLINAGNGLFGVKNKDGAFGYVNANAETVVPFEYTEGTVVINGYALVSKPNPETSEKSVGMINLKNEVVLPFQREDVVIAKDNETIAVWIRQNGVYNRCDLSTGELTPTSYVAMTAEAIGMIIQNGKGLYGLIVNGREVIPCALDSKERVAMLYNHMVINEKDAVNAIEARTMAIKLDPERNNFKLSDTISENYWDF